MSEPASIDLPRDWGDEPVVLTWKAEDGSVVAKGAPLCELEAEKATAEVRSPIAGTIRHLVPAGAVLPGAALGRVIPAGAPVPPPVVPAPAPRERARSERKEAEIAVLAEGRRETLPSTVVAQVVVRDLPDRLRDEGTSLTAAVVHDAARSLRRHPRLNATFAGGPEARIRIAVAFDVDPHGLKTAIVEAADTKDVGQIAGDIQVLLYRYLTGAFAPSELRGATFTVTDVTAAGAAWSVPLLVARQSAILGLGIFGDGADRTLTLALTFDHRVTSGREAAEFLRDLSKRIEARVPARRCWRCGRTLSELAPARRLLLPAWSEGGAVLVCPDCLPPAAQ